MSSQTFAVSGEYRIAYSDVGQGDPILLVHGWGSDAIRNWRDTGWIDTLLPTRRVLTLDVRGHGASDKPLAVEAYTYAEMTTDIVAVLDALEISQCDYLGYSMGAFIGAALLASHADRFRSMVLAGIGNETQESAAAGAVIAQALRAPNVDSVRDPVGRAVRHFVEANPTSDLPALASSAQAMWPDGYPLTLIGDDACAIDVPVLLVNGSEDHPYVDSADAIADALARASHVRLSGCDHLSAVTDPRFKAVVLDFLSDNHHVQP